MISEEAKRFIEGLNKLSQETGLYVYGCGCCNSPRLDKMSKPMTDKSGYAFRSDDDDNSQIEFFEDLSDRI